jgi:hypothetical protein
MCLLGLTMKSFPFVTIEDIPEVYLPSLHGQDSVTIFG